MQQIRVSDLMRACPSAVIRETALLREAAELLVTNNLSVLLVLDNRGQVVGLLAESAVVRELMAHQDRSTPVSRVMARHVESVRADVDLNSILHLFRSSCHAVIPIVDDENVVVGQLHRSDVVRYLLDDEAGEIPAESHGQRPHFLDRPLPARQPNRTDD